MSKLLCHRKTHEIPASPKTFNDMKLDALQFVLVSTDEKYRIGDRVMMVELDENAMPTGQMLKREIIYMMHGAEQPGLLNNITILGLQKGA